MASRQSPLKPVKATTNSQTLSRTSNNEQRGQRGLGRARVCQVNREGRHLRLGQDQDGQTRGGTDRHTDGQTRGGADERTDRHEDRQTDTRTDRHTDRQTHGQTDTRTDTRTDRRTDRQTHGQTDTRTDRHTDTLADRHEDGQHPQDDIPSTVHVKQTSSRPRWQLR